MEDFVKSVVKNFSKEYRQQPLPTDLQAEVKARFHKEKKRYNWLRFRNRSLQSSVVVACGFVLSVNLFPGFSEAARNIPVLDKIVQLVTIKTLTAKKQESEVNIDVPKIQTSQESSVADTLNKKYLKEAQTEFQQVKGQLFDGSRVSVTGDYEKVVDDRRFLVVKRTFTEIKGSSATTTKYDTIDKRANVVVSLPLIFKNDFYIDVISSEIKQQIADQMKNDSNKIYWSEKEDAPSDVQPFKKIKKDQPFYINEKHQLVIVFPQGEIAPYYMGTPEFVIPNQVIENELAAPNYLK